MLFWSEEAGGRDTDLVNPTAMKSSFLTATSLPTDSVHHMEDGRVRSDRK